MVAVDDLQAVKTKDLLVSGGLFKMIASHYWMRSQRVLGYLRVAT